MDKLDTYKQRVLAVARQVEDGSLSSADLVQSIESIKFTDKKSRARTKLPLDRVCTEMCLKGNRCTRSRQEGTDKCKTHNKPKRDPVPDGMVRKVIWPELINGIWYFICNDQQVYNPEDVKLSLPNPAIIGRWDMVDEKYAVTYF
jgi:hypothetical protein